MTAYESKVEPSSAIHHSCRSSKMAERGEPGSKTEVQLKNHFHSAFLFHTNCNEIYGQSDPPGYCCHYYLLYRGR